MTEQQIVNFLDATGHLRMPFGESLGPFPIENLGVDSPEVRLAVESYQVLHAPVLEHIVVKNHPDLASPSVKVSGEVDDDTLELLETSRCMVPDYMPGAQELIGKGNWPKCWGAGDFHRGVISVKSATIPEFLKPHWTEIKAKASQSYAEQGLDLVWKENLTSGFNLELSFVEPDGGWIGLAMVLNGQKCSDKGWLKFDRGYKPANVPGEWLTLVKHELGHNVGMGHSQGGTMNPYILKGLPVSWRGDPSEPLLKARFGGVPIPSTPTSRDLVVAWRYPDGRYETVTVINSGGTSSGPFPT